MMSQNIDNLARILIDKRLLLASVESCTGGLLAKYCTDISGSSTWFERGMVTYSNDSKIEMLGVNKRDIELYGAVSEQIVEQMAKGAINNSHADVGVAVTGIAGPTGGSELKPVGTVWIAWAVGNKINSKKFLFQGNREQVREKAVYKAIEGLIKQIK